MNSQSKPVSNFEFICLMALLMSLLALAIDSVLPALSQLGSDLQVAEGNDIQLVLSSIFFGMAFGLIFYGPISDSFGRKKTIYLGVGVFILGDLISLFAVDFNMMIIGRVIQGFGAAACRVVSLAMIRDKFEGPEMGRVMSLIVMFFIIVPAIAPSIGQGILWVGDWRAIFAFVFVVSLLSIVWLHFRQEETLIVEKRLPFTITVIVHGIKETLSNKTSRNYMLASGFIFGSFIGYLSSSQQLLQVHYQLGEQFALYFGVLALAVGLSSFANSKLVMRYKMVNLCLVSLTGLLAFSTMFLVYCLVITGEPALLVLMMYLSATFFCFGILFGNLNALAVQPLGHIAGVATSVISSIQTLISVFIGGYIGYLYNGSVMPLTIGFLICALLSIILVLMAKQNSKLSAA
ncbi:Bcr/CflA family drug resistance efflux transporter [Psychrosphaera saromensis]|uniref:Bcr/CflA family efflux transporter n=1 Tax=Psychrosphaera saromensis TaxID=716813 RepID=A0A2S7UX94_9GAMM|nr:multidrug effflux MFS transporter [Psychrosphaera saromensis]PQJ54358.1 Bcr/CflA family drug resistance efflux transporter [Psychrosphaera saromensis]GHB60653.1 Bcr/CflA family drug resistance efflux transporter [Psychrosphaera saromensis]GLQ14565.1 Bcr/CflA family drug resistance efflux transporter [Psychrosphaera saromensis]